MKIAVIYNRESQKVINLFGQPNREKYGLKAIDRIVNSLRKGGHQAIALEGDKDLIDNLEEFMPRAMVGERPGMAFNLSYGIQGQARYTHVPGILEMVGVPYVGSGPLAHSLALDKVVAKMLFVQNGVPTPEFAVLQDASFEMPRLSFPLIVKPKNEAVSFGLRIVNDEAELREAAQRIFEEFNQPVLVERYIEGREINVGLLGNNTPEAFVPAELNFGEGGPRIYTEDDKKQKSGRTVGVICPAPISPELTAEAQRIAIRAFQVLGCYDCARVDMRLDDEGNLYILEINSLPSLGEHGSYVAAAEHMGLDFPALINRLVEVAASRYFGTPNPPQLGGRRKALDRSVFAFLTERRDGLEKKLQQWVNVSSRSTDVVGIQYALERFGEEMNELGLTPIAEYCDAPHVQAWGTAQGFDNGTLLVGHLDVPFNPVLGAEHFHRDPEFLFGEGVGTSRAPLVSALYALKALRFSRRLKQLPIGVIFYTDEGRDCVESSPVLQRAMQQAARVMVLRPANKDNALILQRRGQRRYRLVMEGAPLKLGQVAAKPDVMRTLINRLDALTSLTSRKERVAVAAVEMRTEAYPRMLPHRAIVTLQVSYPNVRKANELEARMREILSKERATLSLLSDRPALPTRRINEAFYREYRECAEQWQIPIDRASSLWPSVAGLAPADTPVLCGVGPSAQGLYTGQEKVSRISLIQQTLLLAEFLLASHR